MEHLYVMILAASVFEMSSAKTDRQRCKPYPATSVDVGNNDCLE